MGSQTAIFTRTYDETLNMIVEARNYMTHVEPRIPRHRRGSSDLRFSCEALRVTSRLTQVMAWLMLQRAVHYGEISAEEACLDCNRLSGRDVCLDTDATEDENLPLGLRSLLDRSYHLYVRVSRLEEMVLVRVETAMRAVH
jgi:regulator of CtrA degradation